MKMPFHHRRSRRWPRRLLRLAIAGALSYTLVIHAIPALISFPEGLNKAPDPGVEYTDRNGQLLRKMLSDEDLRAAQPASLEEIPEDLINATLAAEDQRFWSHNGIDYLGVLRALKDAALNQRFVSGASTVTQQLVKISSPPRDRSFTTKACEAVQARKVEMTWTKEQILESYLNRLPYGNLLTGCRAASLGYFQKPMADLSLAECAFLAGLPNAPSRFNPYRNLDGAKQRQEWVLARMLIEGHITADEFRIAVQEPINLRPNGLLAFHAPHLVDLVLTEQQKQPMSGPRDPVKTTINLTLQDAVTAIVQGQLESLKERAGADNDLHAAAVVIDNATGEVLALVGSRNYFSSLSGQNNGAWAPRSPGSTLKPFTYLLALEQGYTAGSILADVPTDYVGAQGLYRPQNYDQRFHGPVTLRHALANSLNVSAVRLLNDTGGPAALHGALERLGFTTLGENPGRYGLGLTIGNAEVRLLELANAYACLARLGEYRPYCLVTPGDDPHTTTNHPEQLFSPEACWLLADILADNEARASTFGLYSPLRFPFKVACKTGTSTDFRDNWTAGYTPDFTVGVWVGNFNNRPLNHVTGVSGAAPIFHDIMMQLHADRDPSWYPKPAVLVEAEIDALSGKRVPPGIRPLRTRKELFRPGNLPALAEASDYGAAGATKLPAAIFAEWFGTPDNSLTSIACLEQVNPSSPDAAASPPAFRIVSPTEGTTFLLDPDLPGGGTRLPLKTDHNGAEIEWASESLSIIDDQGEPYAVLKPGVHELIAIDPRNGQQQTTSVRVERL